MCSDLLRETAHVTPLAHVRHPARAASAPLTEVHSLVFHDLAHQLHLHGQFKIARSAVRLGMSMLDVQRTLHDLRAMDLATFAVDVGWLPMEGA